MATSGILDCDGASAQPPATQVPARRRFRIGYTPGVLVVFLGLLNLADILTTKAVLDRGGAEGNPLMAPLVEGMWGAAMVKLGLLVLIAVLVQRCPRSTRLLRGLTVVVAWYAIVVAWNFVVMAQVA
jgi:hypothetical protein